MSAVIELTINTLGDLWIRLTQADDTTSLNNLDLHILFDNYILKHRASNIYTIAAPCGNSFDPYGTNVRFVSGDRCTAHVLTKYNKVWISGSTPTNPYDTVAGPWITSAHSYVHVDRLSEGIATKLVDQLPIDSFYTMKDGVYTFSFDPSMPFIIRIGQSSSDFAYNVTQFAQFADRNVAKEWAELCFKVAAETTPSPSSSIELRFNN